MYDLAPLSKINYFTPSHRRRPHPPALTKQRKPTTHIHTCIGNVLVWNAKTASALKPSPKKTITTQITIFKNINIMTFLNIGLSLIHVGMKMTVLSKKINHLF